MDNLGQDNDFIPNFSESKEERKEIRFFLNTNIWKMSSLRWAIR